MNGLIYQSMILNKLLEFKVHFKIPDNDFNFLNDCIVKMRTIDLQGQSVELGTQYQSMILNKLLEFKIRFNIPDDDFNFLNDCIVKMIKADSSDY